MYAPANVHSAFKTRDFPRSSQFVFQGTIEREAFELYHNSKRPLLSDRIFKWHTIKPISCVLSF